MVKSFLTIKTTTIITNHVTHLDIGETGSAKHLAVGDRFVYVGGPDNREHEITNDYGSHFEYDGRPNKRLSKDTPVKRVGKHDVGERTNRAVSALETAIKKLNQTGDLSLWMSSMSDIVSIAINYGMSEIVQKLEKLEKLGTGLFSHAKGKHNKSAIDTLNVHSRKQWNQASADAVAAMQSVMIAETSLRILVKNIVRQHKL